MTPGSFSVSAASNRLLWTILEFQDAHSCACSCLDSYQYQLHQASQISYRAWVEERWSRSVQEYLQSWVPDMSIEITRDRHKDRKISEVKLSEHTEDWASTISTVHLQSDRWEALKPYSQNFPPTFQKQIWKKNLKSRSQTEWDRALPTSVLCFDWCTVSRYWSHDLWGLLLMYVKVYWCVPELVCAEL